VPSGNKAALHRALGRNLSRRRRPRNGCDVFAAGLLPHNSTRRRRTPRRPSIEIHATCSSAENHSEYQALPRGIQKPPRRSSCRAQIFPAEIDIIAHATPVASTPSRREQSGKRTRSPLGYAQRSRNPNRSDQHQRHQLRAQKSPAMLHSAAAADLARFSATPYETSAAKIIPLRPPCYALRCNSVTQITTARHPNRNAGHHAAATELPCNHAASHRSEHGFAPFNIPVSAEDTYLSANGNMLSGNAIQNAPSAHNLQPVRTQHRLATPLENHNRSDRPPAVTNVTPPPNRAQRICNKQIRRAPNQSRQRRSPSQLHPTVARHRQLSSSNLSRSPCAVSAEKHKCDNHSTRAIWKPR